MAPAAAHAATAVPDLSAYARARIADGDGRIDLAVADYARALTAEPDNAVLAVRAYREAVRAGDMTLADRAVAVLERKAVAPADASLLALAAAVRSGKGAARASAIARMGNGPFRLLLPALTAWTEHGRANDGAVAGDAAAIRLSAEMQALAILAYGDVAAGLDRLRSLPGDDQAAQDRRIFAARLLIARGRTREARDLLQGEGSATRALRARVGERVAGMAPSDEAGLSYLLARVGADVSSGEPGPVGYTLLRAALRADPGNERARLTLASLLAKEGIADAALRVLDGVTEGSIHAAAAATARVQILAGVDRDNEALGIAQARAARSDASPDEVRRLAALYLRLGRAGEAATVYRGLADAAGATAGAWFELGVALDRAGRWNDAAAALDRALALAPDDAATLNYLGYSLVEHGQRPQEARAMLERAARLQPDDPAIADSLGWALLKEGELRRALPLIERAAAADPASPEINEHLGDAYWQAGRRYEARYAWTAARVVAGDDDDARRLTRKIGAGL